MFPVTLEAKILKAAMEGAKGERGRQEEGREHGYSVRWLNGGKERACSCLSGGDPIQTTLHLEF